MRKFLGGYTSYFYIIGFLWAILLGCSTTPTTPNLPYQGSGYPDSFSKLALNNRLLANELGKLPELRDGISEKEAKALDVLAKSYQENPDAFDSVFKQMYQIGLPEVRKYCSPLQALFWLAESGELEVNKDLIEGYSLKKLLDMSWKFEDSLRISQFQITEIINGIKNEKMRNNYLDYSKRLPTSIILKFINEDYNKNKFAFTKESRKIIDDIKDPRWKNFDVVTERLNAPELIDYYERRRFNYAGARFLRKYDASPKYVFKHNVGECVSITGFTIYCLRKAGYRAKEIRLVPGYVADYHALTLFEMNGKKYIMDNGMPAPAGIHPYVKKRYQMVPWSW